MPVEHIDSAIYPTISLLPMRINFKQNATILQSVQEKICQMVDYENIPLPQIQAWVSPGETMFEVLFSASVRHHAKSAVWTPLTEDAPPADVSAILASTF